MNFEKALSILELKPNFTGDELKKAFRKAAMKWHPDKNNSAESLIKMQEINLAREYLAAYLKGDSFRYTTSYKQEQTPEQDTNNNSELNDYIKNKYTKLEDYFFLYFDLFYHEAEKVILIIASINKVVFSFNKTASTASNKEDVDNIFNDCIQKIKKLFKDLKEEFYKENDINENDVVENINYNCTSKEFYQQLLIIKEKYSKKELIRLFLEKEIAIYLSYPGYERLKSLINFFKAKLFKEIIKNGYSYTQKDIEDMHQSILKQFQHYNFIQPKMLELELKLSKIDDETILGRFKKIKDKFKTTMKLEELENTIRAFEKDMENNYQELKSTKNENEKARINKIYEVLIASYSVVLKRYTPVIHQDEINKLDRLLNDALNLFKDGMNENKKWDFFILFNKINFDFVEYSTRYLDVIRKQLNQKYQIYLKGDFSSPSDNSFFYYLNKETMIMQKIKLSDETADVVSYPVTQEDLEENYISINDFLNKAVWVGEVVKDHLGNKYISVYELYGYTIYIENNKLCIGYNNAFFKPDDKEIAFLGDFENKDSLINFITKQIIKKLTELSNNQPLTESVKL